jgi:biotin carboxyl carrier protein
VKDVIITIGPHEVRATVRPDGTIGLAEAETPAVVHQVAPEVYAVETGGQWRRIVAWNNGEVFLVLLDGRQYEASVETERTRLVRQYTHVGGTASDRTEVHAPMPALVGRVLVEPGQTVQSGQPLLVLEAMKMENEIKAHRGGTVASIPVRPGQTVEKGQLLLTIA